MVKKNFLRPRPRTASLGDENELRILRVQKGSSRRVGWRGASNTVGIVLLKVFGLAARFSPLGRSKPDKRFLDHFKRG
jgi:hypothetical protein